MHKYEHLTREERNKIARENGADIMGVRGDMYSSSSSSSSATSVVHTGTHRATFSTSIDDAIGIEPQAVWGIIAELHTAHGYNAWYDLGVVCICMLGVGTMYLSGISGA